MPNWCMNEVSVWSEDKEELKRFKEFVFLDEDNPFSFQKILPMPEELNDTQSPNRGDDNIKKELVEKYGFDNWYDWRLHNWGTKWESCDAEWHEDEDSLEYSLDTAWSPPQGIYDTLREEFPDVSLNWFYKEEGMQIAGWLD